MVRDGRSRAPRRDLRVLRQTRRRPRRRGRPRELAQSARRRGRGGRRSEVEVRAGVRRRRQDRQDRRLGSQGDALRRAAATPRFRRRLNFTVPRRQNRRRRPRDSHEARRRRFGRRKHRDARPGADRDAGRFRPRRGGGLWGVFRFRRVRRAGPRVLHGRRVRGLRPPRRAARHLRRRPLRPAPRALRRRQMHHSVLRVRLRRLRHRRVAQRPRQTARAARGRRRGGRAVLRGRRAARLPSRLDAARSGLRGRLGVGGAQGAPGLRFGEPRGSASRRLCRAGRVGAGAGPRQGHAPQGPRDGRGPATRRTARLAPRPRPPLRGRGGLKKGPRCCVAAATAAVQDHDDDQWWGWTSSCAAHLVGRRRLAAPADRQVRRPRALGEHLVEGYVWCWGTAWWSSSSCFFAYRGGELDVLSLRHTSETNVRFEL
mmetsp:Transcript_2631/g.10114  ORF Transcript_2631/g.10114 Transcript_2631/m.10114 type:complete len:429 (-) Transcript_2631:31-1317(-)